MNRPILLIRAPVATRSGYGDMARDICRHLINIDKWDVKIVPCAWGNTPMTSLNPSNPKDVPIISRIIQQNTLPRKPEIFISITVPNEFEPIGEYNIGITAGIETTACSPQWIEGMNRMDLILTISNHSKTVLSDTSYNKNDDAGNLIEITQLQKPIEVLPCCVDTNIFKKIPSKEIVPSISEAMLSVKEKFGFLFVGHWLSGNMGEDRKDVGMLIKVFLEVFSKVPQANRPALILKTSVAGFSVIEREELIQRMQPIKDSVNSPNLPSVYVIHGQLTEEEMNSLYNHPKVKTHISFTKGEGFGRPLLEASVSGKPILVSGWSGHLDFLNAEEGILLPGRLEEVHESAVWDGVINRGTKWFTVDYNMAGNYMHHVWKNYETVKNRGAKLAVKNSQDFSFETVQKLTEKIFDKYLPKFNIPQKVDLVLPSLPKLQKITQLEEKASMDDNVNLKADAVVGIQTNVPLPLPPFDRKE